jgi:hypothetical protein
MVLLRRSLQQQHLLPCSHVHAALAGAAAMAELVQQLLPVTGSSSGRYLVLWDSSSDS